MREMLRRPLAFLHHFMHAHDLITVDVAVIERPLAPEAGAFESYIDYFHHNCHFETKWMGVSAVKFPLDAWIYQEIIHDTKPDVIVEIGNFRGGGALFLANMFDILGRGKVIGVDLSHSLIDFRHPRISWVDGDANSDTVLSKVQAKIGRADRVMVIEDSSHTFENTLAVLRNYSGFVGRGMYFVVEDGILRYPFIEGPKPGPYGAIHAFLRENSDFAPDSDREKFRLTYNPDGFLKRIR